MKATDVGQLARYHVSGCWIHCAGSAVLLAIRHPHNVLVLVRLHAIVVVVFLI